MSEEELAKPIEEPVIDQEKQELLNIFAKFDKAVLRDIFEVISMMVKAFEGRPLGDEDVITRLINVRNKMETSRFPTYPLLAKQVYLRLIAKYNPQAKSCEDWADFESEALKAYKGLNWDAYVEMAKASSAPQEQQQFYFGREPQTTSPAPTIMPKRHFWSRTPKQQEQTEFKAQ